MRLSSKMQFGLLAAGVLLAGWECWRHVRQGRELAGVEAQVRAGEQELESRRSALAAAEQRNREVVEAEGRAGNERLLALMRERAAAARSASESAAKTHAFGNALASVLDSPDQQQVEKNYMRDQMRANLDLFFKMTKLSPEKIEQYLDLEIDNKRRDSDRLAALLRGSMSVADALSQRDEDRRQQESRRREILGPEGAAFFDSVADGMRNDEAKRLVGAIQQNMGGEPLSQEQSDKLQGLIKAEIVRALSLDNTDLFRPLEEWTQIVSDRQQNVVRGAAEFLTPAQMETLKGLVALNLSKCRSSGRSSARRWVSRTARRISRERAQRSQNHGGASTCCAVRSRGAANDSSPRFQPWVQSSKRHQPRRGDTSSEQQNMTSIAAKGRKRRKDYYRRKQSYSAFDVER